MELEHQVWATWPGQDKQEFMASFTLARWQWAEKCAQFLRDKGFEDVEVAVALEQEGDGDEQ